MPVEVRELIIKATIAQEDASGSSSTAASSAINGDSPSEAIIKLCVEKVLEILKEKDER